MPVLATNIVTARDSLTIDGNAGENKDLVRYKRECMYPERLTYNDCNNLEEAKPVFKLLTD